MSVNILDQNGNLKKIAHGFSESKFNTFRSDVISNIEMTDMASKDYAVGDFLIMANGQLVQVTSDIYQDTTISLSNVRPTTVEEMIAAKADPADIPDVSKYQKIFTGTMAEWNQLTTEQKTAYDLANITDDLGTEADIVDAVTDGDMRAVTSNAVHDALESKISTSETTGLVKNDGSIDTKNYAEKVANGTENNLAGLDENGNLKDGGWSSDKTTTSATGNPISISGLKSNQLAVNPIITLEPIQAGSGTPSPSNIRAISGYDKIEVLSCGKNICNGNFVQRAFSNGVPETSTLRLASNDFISIKPNTQYTFSATGNNLKIAFLWFLSKAYGSPSYISNDRYVSGNSRTITSPSNANYCIIGVGFNDDSTITPSQISNTQFEEGSSATTYEPYNKTTDLSESLGQTVYGLTHEVRTGKARVTKGAVDLGDLSWSYSSGMAVFYADLPSNTPEPKMGGYDAVCSIYACYTGSYSGQGDKTFTINNTSWESIKRVWIKDSSYTDPTVFKTAVTGQKLVYPLANPIEIQLTPHEISLLKDYAYVSTNGTSISFSYHNGELASLGDVSQLGESFNGLGEYIGANNKGTDVDLSLYTSQSSSYQFPKDGYIVVYGGSATSGNIYVALLGNDNGNFGGIYMNITGTSQMQTTFVKKGMRAYLGSKTASASNLAVVYRPLV